MATRGGTAWRKRLEKQLSGTERNVTSKLFLGFSRNRITNNALAKYSSYAEVSSYNLTYEVSSYSGGE